MKKSLLLACFIALCLPIDSVAQESCVFIRKQFVALQSSNRPPQLLRKKPAPARALELPSETALFPNINITRDPVNDQDEPSIAINPVDPSNIIAGANDYRTDQVLWAYHSTDAGVTWSQQELPKFTSLDIAYDPAIGFDNTGRAFYAFARSKNSDNEIVVHRSLDKGASWSQPFRVHSDTVAPTAMADKEYIAVDRTPASPYSGRIYVVWSEQYIVDSRIVCSYSTDGGLTWSARSQVTPSVGKYQAPVPYVGADGSLYVTFTDQLASNPRIMFSRSTNGGVSFSALKAVSEYRELGPIIPAGDPKGHPMIKGNLRVNSFPSIAADPSTAGRVYLSWCAADPAGRHHVYFTTSTDHGSTWSTPRAIENDPSALSTDKFFNWLAVDRLTGDIGVMFYDSRLDSLENRMVNVFMSFSRDQGATFQTRRVSSESFSPLIAASTGGSFVFFGDYNGLAGLSKRWYPAWTDSRSGVEQEIYIARVQPYAPLPVDSLKVIERLQDTSVLVTWQLRLETAFGFPVGDHSVLLRPNDESVVILPKGTTSYNDTSIDLSKRNEYSVQVRTQDGDTSASRTITYASRLLRTPSTPSITDARATNNGTTITYRIPVGNVLGSRLDSLARLDIFVDGVLLKSIALADQNQGATFLEPLQLPTGFHNVQLQLVASSSGEEFSSELSAPAYLYSGPVTAAIEERFDHGEVPFNNGAWSTTTAGKFSTPVLNDSLPSVNYRAGENTWFLLPPLNVSGTARSLEFVHAASVEVGDSALVEISTNDGLTFQPALFFDRQTAPGSWTTSVATSSLIPGVLSMKHLIGQDVVVRFRLSTTTGLGDGWFIDSIRTTDFLSIAPARGGTSVTLFPQPCQQGTELSISVRESAASSLELYDLLGRKLGDVTLTHGEGVRIQTELLEPGTYFYHLKDGGTLISAGRFVIVQ